MSGICVYDIKHSKGITVDGKVEAVPQWVEK